MALANAFKTAKSFLKSSSSSDSLQSGVKKVPEDQLFPKVDPSLDGEDCDHDCASCDVKYPKSFKIDEDDHLYGKVNEWATHVLVATGKTDWVKHVEDEKGSLMEAIGKAKDPTNGKLMLSASNLPLLEDTSKIPAESRPTTVLLLPSFTIIENVTPSDAQDLITNHISSASTTTSTLSTSSNLLPTIPIPPILSTLISTSSLQTRPAPHRALILLCSQRTRDARCGQSAPLLKREFERHLRPLGLYRDEHDARPGGVSVIFISHVGGHKYSANVMVYRRGMKGKDDGTLKTEAAEAEGKVVEWDGEANQCIWLARVRPQDCEGIIKFTVLQGKVVHPDRQLRGGFDRERGVVSW